MTMKCLGLGGLEKADTLIVGVWEGQKPGVHGQAWEKELPRLHTIGDLTGREAEIHVLYPEGRRRMLVCGLGKPEAMTLEKIRRVAGRAVKKAQNLSARDCRFLVDSFVWPAARPAEVAKALVMGAQLAAYHYQEFRKTGPNPTVPALSLAGSRPAVYQAQANRSLVVAEAVNAARTLANRPGNILYPMALAREAQNLARRYPALTVKVFTAADLKRLNYGALLAVGAGSARPPVLLELTYRGGSARQAPIALVGKGITFDSGGICLKPAAKMDEMRFDMSGAAAVLGILQAAAGLKLKQNLLAVIPAAENMPSGTAYRPGDILTSLSGQTIEVLNTDAEGRLILADALTHAARRKPACIVDLATLTGAVVMALGHGATAVVSNDEQLAAALQRAGESSGERVWPLPLWDDYRELLKSEVADMANISRTPGAGTILGAAFLEKFINQIPWAHLDIAGTAYGEAGPVFSRGATGVGVRLIVEWLESRDATHPGGRK